MSAKFDFKTLETGFAADWPVKVKVPQDGGKIEIQTFEARFVSKTKEEFDALIAEATEKNDENLLLRTVFVGLGKSETDKFTPELRDLMIATQPVREALTTAYREFAGGIEAKN